MAQVRRVQARTDDKHAATADGESTVRCDDGHAFGACVGLRAKGCSLTITRSHAFTLVATNPNPTDETCGDSEILTVNNE